MNLTTQETIQFRALKRSGVILMLILRLDQPTGESEIAEIMDMDTKTVRSHLRSLARIGLITRTHHHRGYLLTSMGRQLLLPLDQPTLDPGLGDYTELEAGDSPPSLQAGPSDLPLVGMPANPAAEAQGTHEAFLAGKTDADGINPPPNQEKFLVKPGEFTGLHITTTTIKENKESTDLNSSSSNHNLEKREYPPDDSVDFERDHQEIITALATRGITLNKRTRRLLGCITVEDVDETYLHLARYHKQTQTGLFIHILEQKAIREELDLNDEKGWKVHRSYQLPASYLQDDDPALQDPARLGDSEYFDGPYAVARAWQQVLQRVRAEIPEVQYQTWLKPAWLLSYNPDPPVLTVGVMNDYCRDWLTAHMTDKLEQLLAETLNYQVRVCFRCFGEVEAEVEAQGGCGDLEAGHDGATLLPAQDAGEGSGLGLNSLVSPPGGPELVPGRSPPQKPSPR